MSAKIISSKEALDKLGMGRWVDWFVENTTSFHRKTVRESDQPIHLYKYRKLDSPQNIALVKSMVVDGHIWLAHKEQLNDRHDLDYVLVENNDVEVRKRWMVRNSHLLDGLGPVDKLVAKDKLIWRKFEENALESTKKQIWSNVGVFCASDDPRSTYMWTHYADNGRGISVQLSSCLDPIFMVMKKVIYQEEMPRILYPSDTWDEVYLYKGLDWAKEKEWRLVLMDNRTVLRIDPAAISGVIIGHAADATVVQTLREYNAERVSAGFKPFKLWRSVPKPTSYGFDIRKI